MNVSYRLAPLPALLLGLGLASATPVSAQDANTLISSVDFVGNETWPSDSLQAAIITHPTACRSWVLTPLCLFGRGVDEEFLNPRELPRDLLRLRVFYFRRGFRETQVDTTLVMNEEGAAEITFLIEEGQPVVLDSLGFMGEEPFADTDLLDNLPIAEGDRFDGFKLDALGDSIQNRLRNRGYAGAEVLSIQTLPSDQAYSGRVVFDIQAGPLTRYGDITVDGEDELAEGTILRTLQFRTGDVYDQSQLIESQGRLYGLEIIRNAYVQADTLAIFALDSVVDVRVEVQEGDLHRVRVGTGFSTAECINAEGRWVHRNFLGHARRFQVRGRVGNLLAAQGGAPCDGAGEGDYNDLTWLLSADLSQPWIFSTRNSLQTSLFVERQSLPGVYIRESVGFNFAITRAIGPRTPLTASYQPELSRLTGSEILFCSSFLVCAPRDIEILEGANWLAPVALTFSRNQADNILDPTGGYTVSAALEHASSLTGSNFRYDRAAVDGTYYHPLDRERFILAGHLRAGWVGSGPFEALERVDGVEIVHPQKRFYAGGANSVRGFPEARMGPRVLIPTSTSAILRGPDEEIGCEPEEIFDLTCDPAGLDDAAFTPFPTGGTRLLEGSVEARFPIIPILQGAAFVDFGQVWGGHREGEGLSGFHVTPGVGARYISPIGPLRLDIAYRGRGAEALRVLTPAIRPFNDLTDDPGDRIQVGPDDDDVIPWVLTEDLAVLDNRFLYGESPGFFNRFQIHLSIGQAF